MIIIDGSTKDRKSEGSSRLVAERPQKELQGAEDGGKRKAAANQSLGWVVQTREGTLI